MELDKKTIKALSADTRIDILKSLGERRKMPTELAKELSLAPSTIAEHLKQLETVDLIEKKDTGHKWIYYQLTGKGSNIVQPRYPINLILALGIGIIFLVGGFSYYFSGPSLANLSEATNLQETVFDEAKSLTPPSRIEDIEKVNVNKDVFSLVFLVLGAILILFSSIKVYRRKH